ncbi:MAG: hypothetical protein GEU78_00870 [Actinobacteria bacterium]|nr:hypothetical protein [Actinomycetota bacterium]
MDTGFAHRNGTDDLSSLQALLDTLTELLGDTLTLLVTNLYPLVTSLLDQLTTILSAQDLTGQLSSATGTGLLTTSLLDPVSVSAQQLAPTTSFASLGF